MHKLLPASLLVGLGTLAASPSWACDTVPLGLGHHAVEIRTEAGSVLNEGWTLNSSLCWPEVQWVGRGAPTGCPVRSDVEIRRVVDDNPHAAGNVGNAWYEMELEPLAGCDGEAMWPALVGQFETDPNTFSIVATDVGSQIEGFRLRMPVGRTTWRFDLYGNAEVAVFTSLRGSVVAMVEADAESELDYIGFDERGRITAVSADGDLSFARTSGISGVYSYSGTDGLKLVSKTLSRSDLAVAKEVIAGDGK